MDLVEAARVIQFWTLLWEPCVLVPLFFTDILHTSWVCHYHLKSVDGWRNAVFPRPFPGGHVRFWSLFNSIWYISHQGFLRGQRHGCFPCIPWLRRWFRNGIDTWLGVPEKFMKFGCSYISLVASLSCINILPPTNILYNCSHHHFATNILVVPTLLSSPLMFRSWAPIAVTQAGRGRGRGLGGRKSVV